MIRPFNGHTGDAHYAEVTTAEHLVVEGHALLEVPQNGGQVLVHSGTQGASTWRVFK
jgi:hypothetical protein